MSTSWVFGLAEWRPSRVVRLPRQGQASVANQKALASPRCNACPSESWACGVKGVAWSRVTRSDLRTPGLPGGERHLGCWTVLSLRGAGIRTRGLGRSTRAVGDIQPSARRSGDGEGCPSGHEEELRSLACLRQQPGSTGEALLSRPLGPRSAALTFNGHHRKRCSDRSRCPQAPARSNVGLRGTEGRRSCSARSSLTVGAVVARSSRGPPSTGGGRSSARRAGACAARGQRRRSHGYARVGRSRVCPYVASSCRSRRAVT